MSLSHPYGSLLSSVAVLVVFCIASSSTSAQNPRNPDAQTNSHACPHDDSGLELPAGFCATVFADGVGHARHLVVAPNGVVYVNTWSGRN
jgi:glucose/arabinose dehydrogenase